MKIYGYGAPGYYAQQVEIAENRKTLIDEAIAARLAEGKIKAAEMAIYAEILQSAENSVKYAKDELCKHAEDETEENAQ